PSHLRPLPTRRPSDLSSRFPQRWWDGQRWTEHAAGPQGPVVDPLPTTPPPQQQQATPSPYEPAQPVTRDAPSLDAASATRALFEDRKSTRLNSSHVKI